MRPNQYSIPNLWFSHLQTRDKGLPSSILIKQKIGDFSLLPTKCKKLEKIMSYYSYSKWEIFYEIFE